MTLLNQEIVLDFPGDILRYDGAEVDGQLVNTF